MALGEAGNSGAAPVIAPSPLSPCLRRDGSGVRGGGRCAGVGALSLQITLIKLPKDSWHVMGYCGSYFISNSKAICELQEYKKALKFFCCFLPSLSVLENSFRTAILSQQIYVWVLGRSLGCSILGVKQTFLKKNKQTQKNKPKQTKKSPIQQKPQPNKKPKPIPSDNLSPRVHWRLLKRITRRGMEFLINVLSSTNCKIFIQVSFFTLPSKCKKN